MGRGGKRQSDKARNCECAFCGKRFIIFGVGMAPKYCSDGCKAISQLNMRGVNLVCQQCKNPFVSVNPDAKYCSKACAGLARVKDEHYRTKHKKVCPICKAGFETTIKSQICCSPKCGNKRGRETQKKYYSCQYCGKPFWRENAFRMKYCSPVCQKAAIRKQTLERHKNDPPPTIYKRNCPECGTEFATPYPSHSYCSDECCYRGNLRLKREQWAAEYVPRTFICKECGAEVTTTCGDTRGEFCCQSCAGKYRRRIDHTTRRHKEYMREVKKVREKQLAAAFVEKVTYEVLFERDNGICAVCGLPVLYDKFADNNWSGTIDHIVPLSEGGEHSMNNCQLAHRVCNSLKSNSLDFVGIDWEKKAQTDNYWKLKYLQGLDALGLTE